MDLTTRYLGFELPHPFMPGASPLADDLDTVRRLEDAGAAAIVMRSLFEEQLVGEQLATFHSMEEPAHSFGEAMTYMPNPPDFALGPEEYLEQLHRIKSTVSVPVFASLNGNTPGGWLEYSQLMAQAGADALELNVYEVATNPDESGDALEQRTLEIVRSVVAKVDIPVAVKLSPFYTSLASFARALEQAGARGMILFNRLYQPDFDIEELEIERSLHLSDSSELLLRLTWLAVLSGNTGASLGATGGVHTAVDAIKTIMAGAHAVQMVSALLRNGPDHLRTVRQEVAHWMEEHEYESLAQMQGNMNLQHCPDAKAFERINYVHLLHSWQPYVGSR
jgi:dihydroorotate dehydrogenase (fumarate)